MRPKFILSLFLFLLSGVILSQSITTDDKSPADGYTDRTARLTTSFTASQRTVCIGEQVQFTDLSVGSPTQWNWQLNGASPSTSMLQNPACTYNIPGNYNVVLSISDGVNHDVMGVLKFITVVECTGIMEATNSNGTCVFPNPCSDLLKIYSPLAGRYEVLNMLGGTVQWGTLQAGETRQIEFEAMPSGSYFVRVSNDRGTTVQKVLK